MLVRSVGACWPIEWWWRSTSATAKGQPQSLDLMVTLELGVDSLLQFIVQLLGDWSRNTIEQYTAYLQTTSTSCQHNTTDPPGPLPLQSPPHQTFEEARSGPQPQLPSFESAS